MSFTSNISFTLVSRGLVALINLVTIAFTSRVLGPAGRGEVSLLMTDLSLIMMLQGVFGGSTIVYHIPKLKNIFSVVSLALILVFPLCIVVNLIFDLFNPTEYRLLLLLVCFVSGLNSIGMNVLLAQKKMALFSLVVLVSPIVTLAVFYMGMTQSIHAYIMAFLIGQIGVGIVLIRTWLVIFKSPLVINRNYWKTIVRYGLTNEISAFIQFLSYRVSFYILLWYTSEGDVGFFSNGVALCESLWIISRSIAMNQYAEIVNNPIRAKVITFKSLKYITILILPSIVLLLFIPDSVYVWIFSPKFNGIKNIMFYLMPGVLLLALSSSWAHYFSALGYNHINYIKAIIGLFLSVTLLLILTPLYGIIGAALATSLGYGCSFLILCWFYYFRNPVR